MSAFTVRAGLTPRFTSPPIGTGAEEIVTEEAAVGAPDSQNDAFTSVVKEGDLVGQGAAVARSRNSTDICLVAPIAGRVARVTELPGHKLQEILLFREVDGGVRTHDLTEADSESGLRRLMQGAGLWPLLRRRPFGGMPDHAETPAAIVVMAVDTRPFAPDPIQALCGREEAISRGLAALLTLTEGPVFVCRPDNRAFPWLGDSNDRLRAVQSGSRHPQGSAGIRIHQAFPAGLEAPVWDIHAEDVAALGELLSTGQMPMMRLVHIAGEALRDARSIRTHPGADLRQLTQRIVAPGPHVVMSGSPLDGHRSHWLRHRDRQVTVLRRETDAARRPHWLLSALTRSASVRPAIPTAALSQAFGAALPATPFIRALGAGDDETAMKLGILSLLEEDVALADYVLSETGQVASQLRAMLDRIQSEYAA
ncbi:Na(+)-translocating NADH-quinone reductase subunit A [Flavimaricola marinus]|uniref:Na(+)-translocating NADH-quinone reductase subunit A n=1 Tax=Flavimaricola marinus TaxID=1819565 RepID=A0A238LC87_9RHOB|nr:Na(+)-translocating NADH-quinone reductase subunit A [Flavimaricola marinus]SMY07309.1 Na(+)-translocating NADH-quinone reductase subunit A [Flavimaricola marinus]